MPSRNESCSPAKESDKYITADVGDYRVLDTSLKVGVRVGATARRGGSTPYFSSSRALLATRLEGGEKSQTTHVKAV